MAAISSLLQRLPVKSLLRLRCVSKAPRCNLLHLNSKFIKMHHNHAAAAAVENEKFNLMLNISAVEMYMCNNIDSSSSSSSTNTCYEAKEIHYPFKFMNPSVYIRGACNGLFCLDIQSSESYKTITQILCIWNPCTKEYKEVPEAPFEFPSHLDMNRFIYDPDKNIDNDYSTVMDSFGYDHKTGDYKVVRVSGFYGNDYNDNGTSRHLYYGSQLMIYTLKSNVWKCIPSMYPYDIRGGSGVLVNGALHWIATPLNIEYCSADYCRVVVVSFDLADERLTDVSPLVYNLDRSLDNRLCTLGGCLCIYSQPYNCTYTLNKNNSGFSLWVMKDYGIRESWTKLFTIAQHSLLGTFFELTPIRSFNNGEILLNVRKKDPNNDWNSIHELVLYDPKLETVRRLNISDVDLKEAIAYEESLVSLNTGIYSGLKIERVEKSRD